MQRRLSPAERIPKYLSIFVISIKEFVYTMIFMWHYEVRQ